MNVHVERVWSNAIEVAGTCATLGTNVTITVNDQRCHRDGERFYCLLEVPNAAGAVETNITVLAVGGGLVRAASGTVYVAECDEAVTHADRGVIAADSRYAYEFDGFGRLISVTSSNASPAFRLCFGYDADGRRAWKRVLGWTGSAWVTNRTHAFVYDGWNLVAERITGSGTSTCFYTWGLDLAGQKSGKLGQEAGGIGGLLAITEISGSETNVYFPVCDHIGTIRALADTNGALVARFEYSPFGVLTRTWGSQADLCSFRFSSKYYDAETELLYYGHRYHDPASTKWLSRDPIAERGGANLTQFCHGDPVNRYDAVGMENEVVIQEIDTGLRPLDESAIRIAASTLGMSFRRAMRDQDLATMRKTARRLVSSDIYVYRGHACTEDGVPVISAYTRRTYAREEDVPPHAYRVKRLLGGYRLYEPYRLSDLLKDLSAAGAVPKVVIITGCEMDMTAWQEEFTRQGVNLVINTGGEGEAGINALVIQTLLQSFARGETVGQALEAANRFIQRYNMRVAAEMAPQQLLTTPLVTRRTAGFQRSEVLRDHDSTSCGRGVLGGSHSDWCWSVVDHIFVAWDSVPVPVVGDGRNHCSQQGNSASRSAVVKLDSLPLSAPTH